MNETSWLLDSLDSIAAMSYALSSPDQGGSTLAEIFPIVSPVFGKIGAFSASAFFVADADGLEFSFAACDPPSAEKDMIAHYKALLHASSLGWAIQQHRPVQLPISGQNASLVVSGIATRAAVRGIFIGVLEGDFLPDTTLKLLTLVVSKCANVIEIGILYKSLQDQHRMERNQDAEERSALHAQLIQSQKMEALGRFAGGLAHDFNNLLTAITANLSLCLLDVDDKHPLFDTLKDIEFATKRASNLTVQLLTFSRRQTGNMEVLSINDSVESTSRMLARLLGESIVIQLQLDSILWMISGDRGQIDQVLVNLAVNARDAMPAGGVMVFETKNLTVPASDDNRLPPGEWVHLSVSDNGIGMDEHVQQHIFEPFFTTKPAGIGTGLGLSVVFGIITRHAGHLRVRSTPNEGTTIDVFFPRTELIRSQPTTRIARPSSDSPPGDQTILLAEDNLVAREATVKMLRRLGYQVIVARDGTEGLTAGTEFIKDIDLLLTDVVMPGLSGPELARELHKIRPELRVLFISGYPGDSLSPFNIDEDEEFLRKPFNLKTLSSKLRQIFGASLPPI